MKRFRLLLLQHRFHISRHTSYACTSTHSTPNSYDSHAAHHKQHFTKQLLTNPRIHSCLTGCNIILTKTRNVISTEQSTTLGTRRNNSWLYFCKTLHRIYIIEPLNTHIHRRAQNTWAPLLEQEDVHYHNIIDNHTNTHTNHTWWPRTLPLIEAQSPIPIYAHIHWS